MISRIPISQSKPSRSDFSKCENVISTCNGVGQNEVRKTSCCCFIIIWPLVISSRARKANECESATNGGSFFSLCLSVYFFSFLSREDEARETTDVSDSSSGSGNGNSSSSSSFSLWFLHLAHLNSQCLPRAAIKDIHACTELALFLFTDDAMNNVASLTLYLLNQSETVRL